MAIAAFKIPPRIAGHLQHTVVSFPPPTPIKIQSSFAHRFPVSLSQEEVSPYLHSSH